MNIIKHPNITLAISFIVAVILTIIPLPQSIIMLRPQFILLLVIFTSLSRPPRMNVFIAWGLGLFLDLLLSNALGLHAIALTTICYLCIKFQSRINMFHGLQQALIVFGLSLLYTGIIFWFQGLMGNSGLGWSFWLAPLTSLIFWPLVSVLLGSKLQQFQSGYIRV